MAEEGTHLSHIPRARPFRFEQREGNGDEDERGDGGDGHSCRRDGAAPGEEQQDAECRHGGKGAQCLADAGEIEFVRLLETTLVYVGEAVDDLVDVDAHGQHEHAGAVIANGAVQESHHECDDRGDPAIELIRGEGVLLVDVRYLERPHAVVRQEHEQGAGGERHGEASCLFGAGELGGDDGEHGKDHAPYADADGVPHVVAPCFAAFVLCLLCGEPTVVNRFDKPRPPGIRQACEWTRFARGGLFRGFRARAAGSSACDIRAVAISVTRVEIADFDTEVVERM